MNIALRQIRAGANAIRAAVIAGPLLLAGHAMAADDYSEWFSYADTAAVHWTLSAVDGQPNQVRILPKYLDPTADTEKVLVLYSKQSSAYQIAITKILEIFQDKSINVEFLIVNYEDDDALGQSAIEIAEAQGSDLIFSMGSNSTAWLWDNYQGGSIPVVTVCSKDPVVLGQIDSYDIGTGNNFAFTSLNMPVEVQMAYVLDLLPNLRNMAVLVDSQNISAVETQANPIAEFARTLGLQVLYLAVEEPDNAREELVDLVGGAVSIMQRDDPALDASAFWITGSTSVFREIETINQYSDRVPVLSVAPEVVQPGRNSAVVSIGVSFESNAHLAAIYGVDVIQGRSQAGELPVGIVSPPDIAINFLRAREIEFDIPFSFFESASTIYDNDGILVRSNGESVVQTN